MENVITLEELKEGFKKAFNNEPTYFFSAPGRTELSGNHTDHQHGRVLAASINLDNRAAVCLNNTNIINVVSVGHKDISVSLDDLSIKEEEIGTSMALVRGIVNKFNELGFKVKGFNAYIKSNVKSGSGLSSSAAFEVLVATIVNTLCNAGLSAVELAKIGQYSENVYFKKPCGLMDQMASSVGNAITINFKDNDNPIIEKIDFDFSKCGYTLCVIDSGASHADLTNEYAAITEELKKVCAIFNKKWLVEVDENEFMSSINEVREKCGDRAVLRAIHVYSENERVIEQVNALKNNDFNKYLVLMKESGKSSYDYLQNVIPCGNYLKQELALAIGVSEKILGENGVCRVHGGGFAGTLQAFVKDDFVEEFKNKIEKVLGKDTCHILQIVPFGGRQL